MKKEKDNSTRSKLEKMDPEFVNSVEAMSSDDLKSRIVLIAKQMEEVSQAKKDDLDLQRAKEQLKVMNETYSEPLKAAKLKTKYLIELLASRGQ